MDSDKIEDVWKMLETEEGRTALAKRMCLPIQSLPWTSDLIKHLENKLIKLNNSIANVANPINNLGFYNRQVCYCCNCGKTVKSQKYCHGCGYKLNWKSLKKQPKLPEKYI